MSAEFFLDPRFLAPIATCAGIIVTLVLWIMNARTKELSYQIVSNTPLVTVREEVNDQVQIYLRGEVVHNVHLIILKVMNSGNTAIRSADFEGKMTVSLPEGSKVLLAEVLETYPTTLDQRSSDGTPKPLIDGLETSRVYLRPVLLNPKDHVTIKLMASPNPERITVVGHIEGIHEVKQAKDKHFMPIVLANVGSFIMATSLFFLDPSALFNNRVGGYLPYLMFFVLGYVMLLSGVYYPRLDKLVLRKARSAA